MSYQVPAYLFSRVAQLAVGGEDEKDLWSRHFFFEFLGCSF